MTNDNKPLMFGPSGVFDPATYEPRSGKSALMNEMAAELAGKPTALAETIIGNCTTSLPCKFKVDPKDGKRDLATERAEAHVHAIQARRDSVKRKLEGAATP